MGNRAACPVFFREWSEGIVLCRMAMEFNVAKTEQLLSQTG